VLGDAEVLIGTQGWNYAAWVGAFYPEGTAPSRMLEVYARAFETVEVDSTAYGIPSDPAVHGWQAKVPDGFRFALKVPQEVTHERRLKDTTLLVRRFLDRVEHLGDRLGPLLVQLSPGYRATDGNRAALRTFIGGLPAGFRWAVEFRHPGWMTPATFELLKTHNVATVLVDGRWIRREMMQDAALEPTADFAYVRWMGPDRRLTDFSKPSLDRADDLQWWVALLRSLRGRVGEVFAYFSNYHEGHAPHSARVLQEHMGQQPVSPDMLREQGELF
jgi:uncharacterized protein YecE (DUF72 family)